MMRSLASIVVCAAALTALLASALLPASAQEVPIIQVDAPTPAVGDWRQMHGGMLAEQYTIIEVADDHTLVRVGDDPRDDIGNIYRTDRNLNVLTLETATGYVLHSYEPSTMRYQFPLYVGKTWSGTYDWIIHFLNGSTEIKETVQVECEVMCLERVDVNAGRFDSFKIMCNELVNGEGKRRQSYWYAPAVGGAVRQESIEVKFGHDYPAPVWELLDFHQANKVEFTVLPPHIDSTCDAPIP